MTNVNLQLPAMVLSSPHLAAAADTRPLQISITRISDTFPPPSAALFFFSPPLKRIVRFSARQGCLSDTVANLALCKEDLVHKVKYHESCSDNLQIRLEPWGEVVDMDTKPVLINEVFLLFPFI